MKMILAGAALTLSILSGPALAQQGAGPVAKACVDDLSKFCSGKSHQNREARTCLEANKSKISAVCKAALESTGGGQGKGKGKN